MSNPRSLHWLIVTLDSPQQFHIATRIGVEKLVASPAPSPPPVFPLRVPSPRSNRGGSRGVHVCAHHRTGKTKDERHYPKFILQFCSELDWVIIFFF